MYVGREHTEHLKASLEEHYEISTDWTGSLYYGITMKWDYVKYTVDLFMPGYAKAILHCFQHPDPVRPHHSPHKHQTINYGAKVQFVEPDDVTNPLTAEQKVTLQQVVGCLLYYEHAIDPTMLVALSTLASAQTKGTQATTEAMVQLLNYCATHPDAEIQYHASDMILHFSRNASYLFEAEARSRTGGHFYLGQKYGQTQLINVPLLFLSNIMNYVISSAAEAEVGSIFIKSKETAPLLISQPRLFRRTF
jgi:hypothetical protein